MVGITHVHGSCQLGKSLPSILAALGGDGPLRRRHARAVETREPGNQGDGVGGNPHFIYDMEWICLIK